MRKRTEAPAPAPEWAGVVAIDIDRKVAVGPFEDDDTAVAFMEEQGHKHEALHTAIMVTPEMWAETGELV